MPRKVIKSDELWATNLPYSYGAIAKGGQFPDLWGSGPSSQEGAPATLVGVTKLGYDGGLVEIEVVAHVA